jgi:16S rRNA (uracil1498-N3)-methyltransferase
MQAGQSVEVFDGQGRVADGTLCSVARNEVVIQTSAVRRFQPLQPRIHLCAAILKGDRMDWLLEKSVELGVHSVRPWLTTHCVVRLRPDQMAKKTEKWRQILIAAAKQCHIPFLPELHPPQSLTASLASLPPGSSRWVAALSEDERGLEIETHVEDVVVAIGPEGDFSADEMTALRDNHFQPATLGPLILRAETAAVVALAQLTQHRRRLIEVTAGA